jgi:hypothetical protein
MVIGEFCFSQSSSMIGQKAAGWAVACSARFRKLPPVMLSGAFLMMRPHFSLLLREARESLAMALYTGPMCLSAIRLYQDKVFVERL